MPYERISESEGEYQQLREITLAGALWPESFSGVFSLDRGFIPVLRFREGEADFSGWPQGEDIDCDMTWVSIGGALGDPDTAELISLLVVEWPENELGYRFAIDMRTSMRRVFWAIETAKMQLGATAAPKGTTGHIYGLTLPESDEFKMMCTMSEYMETREDLWLDKRNGE